MHFRDGAHLFSLLTDPKLTRTTAGIWHRALCKGLRAIEGSSAGFLG
jgi:hypothetical protein